MTVIMSITHTGRAPYPNMIDAAIAPSQPELPGLNGGPPRQVAALIWPTGRKSEFVVNEAMYHAKNAEDLQEFLDTYDGTVLGTASRW